MLWGEFSWPGGGLRGQSVELFGQAEALFEPTFELPFAQHVHQFNADQSRLCGLKGLDPQPWSGHPLHCSMILFYHVV
jgi:hypothetical protein